MTPSAPAVTPPAIGSAITASHRVAAIRLFNPTQWSGAGMVELPVGASMPECRRQPRT